MNAESVLLILFGMLSGGALTWVQCWRFARKLEHHGVKLSEWDTERIDWQAKPVAHKITSMGGRGL